MKMETYYSTIEWVNVFDRLPKPEENVLVTDGKRVLTGYRVANEDEHPLTGWMVIDVMHFVNDFLVTWWAKLPDPF